MLDMKHSCTRNTATMLGMGSGSKCRSWVKFDWGKSFSVQPRLVNQDYSSSCKISQGRQEHSWLWDLDVPVEVDHKGILLRASGRDKGQSESCAPSHQARERKNTKNFSLDRELLNFLHLQCLKLDMANPSQDEQGYESRANVPKVVNSSTG